MGTRAAFWVGDPRDYDNREWLGCVAWDGYPAGVKQISENIPQTEEEFREAVRQVEADREDFASPENGSWPFPWVKNIFLTDVTYAFFNGKTQITRFHRGFVPLEEYDEDDETYSEREDDPTLEGVQYEGIYDRSQPDSIIILGVRKD